MNQAKESASCYRPFGDDPQVKWGRFSHAIPADLSGKSVLDIGCNGGFYSTQMKKRGAARVLAIDTNEEYLEQARSAAQASGTDIEFRNLSVYRVGELRELFDLILFMGVLYQLRHPLLALDMLREFAVADLLVTQSILRGAPLASEVPDDVPAWDHAAFADQTFPRTYFIERTFAGDPTNRWIPNQSGFEAMLRSAGFKIVDHPEHEVYVCRRAELDGPTSPTQDLWDILR